MKQLESAKFKEVEAELVQSLSLGVVLRFSLNSPIKSSLPSQFQKQAMVPRPSSHHRAAAFALLCLCSVSSSANGES